MNVSRDNGENKGKEIPSPRRSAAVVIQPLDAMLDPSTSAASGRSGSHQIRNSDKSSEESSAPPRAEDDISALLYGSDQKGPSDAKPKLVKSSWC